MRVLNTYLRGTYGKPAVTATRVSAKAELPKTPFLHASGIIHFDLPGHVGYTGHFTLWDGRACAYGDHFADAASAFLWRAA